jgi:hypothetical protein
LSIPPIRRRAVEATEDLEERFLRQLAESEAFDHWVVQLNGPNRFRRWDACQALGQLGDLRAVDALIERLGDQDASVCRAACRALDLLGERRLAYAVVGALGGKAQARQELARLAHEGDLRAVDPLIEQWQRRSDAMKRPSSMWHKSARRSAFLALESIRKALKHPHQLFCRSCLARFQQQDDRPEGEGALSMPVCRLCGRAVHAVVDVREVVAVLDTEMSEELSCADGVARVSYLKRDAPFDFDRVEIVRASDYEVERFCVQVSNDSDPFRKGRYRKMRCLVAPGRRLSENTLRILRSMFGKVEVRA